MKTNGTASSHLERDALTGLLNPNMTEAKINQSLSNCRDASLILLNLNGFRNINEEFGHLAGDDILKQTAQIFSHLFWSQDIVGRIGGDEIAALLTVKCSKELIDHKLMQCRFHLKTLGKELGIPLTARFGVALQKEGDDYQSLLHRARQDLSAGKKRNASNKNLPEEKGICTDVALIRKELREQGDISGAYCPDYQTFKQLYHFVERGLIRSNSSAFILLITLTDQKGQFLPPALQEQTMLLLKEVIRKSLRSGDAFTRYSSGQYILMVLGSSQENAGIIGQRIQDAFQLVVPDDPLLIQLRRDVYPLEAASGKG